MSPSSDVTAAARSLLAADSEMAIYRASVELLATRLPTEKCLFATIASDALAVQVETANGVESPDARLPLGDDAPSGAIRRGEATVVDDLTVRGGDRSLAESLPSQTRSLLSAPVGEHGVLLATAEVPGAFSEPHLAEAVLIASVTAASLEHRHSPSAPQRNPELLTEVASILSHDLKTPLAIATGTLELLREDHDSAQLTRIAAALDRLETMLDDVVTLARTGDRVDASDNVSVEESAETAWEMVEANGATLTIEGSATVRADRSRLRQVFENLFRNAIGHAGPTVTLRVGLLEERSGFYIEDDGPGIPADRRDRVFEYGYSSTADQSGFGLAIVRQIVEAHGWTIRVVEGTKGGARFEITGVEFEAPPAHGQ